MKKNIYNVQLRAVKENLNKIRKTGVPANIFQSNKESRSIVINTKDFLSMYSVVGESAVAYLSLDKTEIPVTIEEVQWHPTKDTPVHVSFRAVDLKQKTEALIPVVLVGKFDVPDAVLVTVRDEIEVEALPTDLPEHFEINIESLTEIGQSITLADLVFDRNKVKLIIGEEGEEAPIILVQEVREEVEEETEELETEIIGEKEKDEEDETKDSSKDKGNKSEEESSK